MFSIYGEERGYFFEFGEFQLHPVERQLLSRGKVIPLTPKAFDTLRLLVENSGHLLEKNRLMELLWADAFVEEGNLTDNISKIRQAFGDSRKDPKFIETVSGRGYRFIANVRRGSPSYAHAAIRHSLPSAAGTNAAEQSPNRRLMTSRQQY